MTRFLLAILAAAALSGTARAEPGIIEEAATEVGIFAQRCKGFVLGSLVCQGMTQKQAAEILGPWNGGFLAGAGFVAFYGNGLSVYFCLEKDSDGDSAYMVNHVRNPFAGR